MTDESPLEKFSPRIATQIVEHWGQREFEKFASDLIIDTRGDRRGLPKDVLSDILFLYALHLDMWGYNPQDSFLPN